MVTEPSRPPPIPSNPSALANAQIDAAEPLVPLEPALGLDVRAAYLVAGVPGAELIVRVRRSVAARLHMAGASMPRGMQILVLDGWRNVTLQRALYARIKDRKYAFDLDAPAAAVDYPTDDAPHRTGGAVDVTLADAAGVPLDMGSGFDDPSALSHTAALESDPAAEPGDPRHPARLARRLLYHVMTSAGFSNYVNEWWHYDFGNAFWRHFGKLPPGPVYRTVE